MLLLSVFCTEALIGIVAQERPSGQDRTVTSGVPFFQRRLSPLPDLPFSIPPLPKRPSIRSPYTFFINAGNYKREETSDEHGNVRGVYSYSVNNGVEDSDRPRRKPFPTFPWPVPGFERMPQLPFLPIPQPFPPSSSESSNEATSEPQGNKSEETERATVIAETTTATTTDEI